MSITKAWNQSVIETGIIQDHAHARQTEVAHAGTILLGIHQNEKENLTEKERAILICPINFRD